MGDHAHHNAAVAVSCAVLTASDTRDLKEDTSGARIAELLDASGHRVIERRVVRDEPDQIRGAIDDAVGHGARAVLINGGTGIAPRDRTFEAVSDLIERPLPGFGEIFRSLSFEEIGSAAMLSRACAGIYGAALLVSMPGSQAAVELAMTRLVLPELAHVLSELERDST